MWSLRSISIAVLLLSVLALGLASPVRAANPVYSFGLSNATAVSPSGGTMMASPGDTISVSGTGTFDPVARTVQAGGTFVHYDANGAAVCQGQWQATSFTSFVDFGTNAAGQEGGVLSLVVTHHCYCTQMGMTMTMTGIPMTVTSTAVVPPYSHYVQGITVSSFTEPTGGTVVMRP